MSVGTSVFLIAVGAILRYAVTFESSAIDIQMVGLILMIAGTALLIASLAYNALSTTRRRVTAEQHATQINPTRR